MSDGPTIRRGKSDPNVETPWEFIDAVEAKFGLIARDLAATEGNHKARTTGHYIGLPIDSLAESWHQFECHTCVTRLCWLNPPYDDIAPWARKCAQEAMLGAQILLLVPGSVGANWYWDWVEPYADIYSVGRMKFVGHTTAYPKDLLLCHYHGGQSYRDKMVRWLWKKQL